MTPETGSQSGECAKTIKIRADPRDSLPTPKNSADELKKKQGGIFDETGDVRALDDSCGRPDDSRRRRMFLALI
jgi:hypothetical protein